VLAPFRLGFSSRPRGVWVAACNSEARWLEQGCGESEHGRGPGSMPFATRMAPLRRPLPR
jgi:hypothetical protein